MAQRIHRLKFSYFLYNSILILKFSEVVIKKFLKFVVLSRDAQKKRFFWERLGFLPKAAKGDRESKWVWVHANSIGEVNASVSLISKIKESYPSNRVLITTTNFSADARARQLNIADAVVFFPYDLPLIIKRVFKIFNPLSIIIIECDVWPNFVRACRNSRIPVSLVSGIFKNGHTLSVGLRPLYNFRFTLDDDVFKNIEQFCMQTEEDAARIAAISSRPKQISVTGNLKFSIFNGNPLPDKKDYYKKIFKIRDSDPVFVAGNIHREEIGAMLGVFMKVKQAIPGFLMILAPRFIKDVPYAQDILRERGIDFIRRTRLGLQERAGESVILLDSMGELAAVYGVANVAFVGGSLVYLGEMFGGHNILEPAVSGVPVLFGPYMHNFQHLADLFRKRQAAIQVNSSQEIINSIIGLLKDPEYSKRTVSLAMSIFEENKDVTERTFAKVNEKIKVSSDKK